MTGLVYTHRWLGIAGCLLFLTWFVSGVVLMYARMPSLTAEERLAHLPSLDTTRLQVSPGEAARLLPDAPRSLRIGMYAGRPVYRFSTATDAATVFADTGETLAAIDAADAGTVARELTGLTRSSDTAPPAVTRLEAADQWTLSSALRGLFPLYRVALGDADGTDIYVSSVTAEPILKTTRSGRTWGYLGAVIHWLYFTPLRRDGALWVNVVVYLSLAGCLMCLSGLVWGVWRFSPSARFRLQREPSHTPYAGMMRWHHYAGLLFGLTTFTWMFSGLMSMDPWDWHPSNTPSRAQREAVAGGPFTLDAIAAADLRLAVAQAVAQNGAREVEVVQFAGAWYVLGLEPPTTVVERPWANTDIASFLAPSVPLPQAIVPIGQSVAARERFADADIEAAAARAMPGVPVRASEWLHEYDAYYYARDGGRPLPVLRVTYDDAVNTALYLDPLRGAIVLKEERWSRANRWLYHGLHSFDFPLLYWRRPLWDLLLVGLSLGGLISTVTAMWPAWRRLRRHATGR